MRRLGSLRLRSLILRCLFLRNRCCSVAILLLLPAEWSIPKSLITVWIGGSFGLSSLANSLWMVLSVTMKAVLWLLTTNPTACRLVPGFDCSLGQMLRVCVTAIKAYVIYPSIEVQVGVVTLELGEGGLQKGLG